MEQSTFTVEKKLNVEIDMNGDGDEDKKEWSIHYVNEEDNTEKKDVGKEKIES